MHKKSFFFTLLFTLSTLPAFASNFWNQTTEENEPLRKQWNSVRLSAAKVCGALVLIKVGQTTCSLTGSVILAIECIKGLFWLLDKVRHHMKQDKKYNNMHKSLDLIFFGIECIVVLLWLFILHKRVHSILSMISQPTLPRRQLI